MKTTTKQTPGKTLALALLLAATCGLNATAQDDTVVYGSVLSSMKWGEGCGPGIYSFGATSTTALSPVKIDPRLAAQGGGAYADGKYYSINAERMQLSIYDADTWELLEEKPMAHAALDLAYDPISGKIYACYVDAGVCLGTLNAEKGDFDRITNFDTTFSAIFFDNTGQLYGISFGELLKIDKASGQYTVVGDTGVMPMYAQSATVDPTTGKCYWASMTADFTSALYEVNMQNAELTLCRQFEGMDEITGLYILPHVDKDAPAKATNLNANFANGNTTGKVYFSMPTVTKGGEPLSGKLGYKVVMGNQTKEGTAEAGEAMELETTQPEGRCKIVVTTNNAKGESERAAMAMWVGYDTPATVGNLALKRTADQGLKLQWDAVTTGAHNGYVDAEKVTYKVVRQPEGKTISDNATTTVVYDNVESSQLAKVWYEVTPTANGKEGATKTSNKVIVGQGKEMPYNTTFTDEEFNYLTIFDANNDGKTWSRNEYMQTAEYAGDAMVKADDWLITPPLKLNKSGYYKVVFNVRCNSQNKHLLAVALGNLPEQESMTQVVMPETEFSTQFQTQTVEAKFLVPEDGDYYLGFHLTSDALMHSFDIQNISVEQYTTTDTPAAVADLDVKPAAKGELKSEVAFTLPSTTIGGEAVGTLTSAEVYRDGTLLKSFAANEQTLKPGEKITVSDNQPQNGFNTYSVVVSNDKGKGDEASLKSYVGIDTPAAVENITLSEPVDGTVVVSWQAPTKGANGGYVDPEELTYTVRRNGWMPLEANAAECSATDVISDLGNKQGSFVYVVNAISKAGISTDATSRAISAGKPYETPMEESFANAMATYSEWAASPRMGERSWGCTTSESQDGDNGCIGYTNVGSTGELTLVSPKILTDDTMKPVVSFWVKHSAIDDGMEFEVITPDNVYHRVDCIDLSQSVDGWTEYRYDLSAFADNRFVQLAFHTDNIKSDEKLYIDNIKMVDNLDHNLKMAELKAPGKINVGTEKTVTAIVKNVGAKDAEAYSVKLYAGDRLLAEKQGSELKANATTEMEFGVKPEVSDLPVMQLKAVVEYSLDENAKNDTAKAVVNLVAPDYPVVSDLNGEWNGEAVSLKWTAPDLTNLTPQSTVESFEQYEPFTITDFGKWKVVDAHGNQYSMEFQTNDGRWITYPNSGEGISFQVIDLTQIIATEADGWSSVNGDKILISPYCGSMKQDWLISPELYGGSQKIAINAKSLNFRKDGLEGFTLLYSTTGTETTDFKELNRVENIPEQWTEYSFDLPEGAKYFAIYVEGINTALFLDDIKYVPVDAPKQELALNGYNVYRNGMLLNTAPVATTSYDDHEASTSEEYTYRVTAVYDKGESDFSNALTVNTATAITETSAAHGKVYVAGRNIMLSGIANQKAGVWTADGKCVWSSAGEPNAVVNVSAGCYIVKIGNSATKILVK